MRIRDTQRQGGFLIGWHRGCSCCCRCRLGALRPRPRSCPNEAFRTGSSVRLPDCRAYELVSPPDANGRLLEPISGFGVEAALDLFPTELASPTRDSMVYKTYSGPLPSPPGANGDYDVYEALSAPGRLGRPCVASAPSGHQAVIPTPGGVSSDHDYAFTHVGLVKSAPRPAGSLGGRRRRLTTSATPTALRADRHRQPRRRTRSPRAATSAPAAST